MILKAKKVFKSFDFPQKVDLIFDLNLEVEKGESIAITGRSGEGKTTLLHILGSLEAPDSGEIFINNEKVTSKNRHLLRAKNIGFIFQSYNLLEDFSALENVLMPSKILRKPYSIEKGLELLNAVGLSQRKDFPVKLLSGGERQRVAIARALCNDPDLILADEPTGNLDHYHAKEIGDLLFSLIETKKKSLILVTHDQKLAQRCLKTYELNSGQLQKSS